MAYPPTWRLRMPFCMVISLKRFIWNNLLASFVLITLITFFVYAKPYMVSNKFLVLGTSDLLSISCPLDSPTVVLLTLFLPFIVVGRPSISFLYVDDISLTASTTALITKVISLLSAEFAITNLGPLSFFSALLLLVPLKVCFSHKLLSPKSSCPVPTWPLVIHVAPRQIQS